MEFIILFLIAAIAVLGIKYIVLKKTIELISVRTNVQADTMDRYRMDYIDTEQKLIYLAQKIDIHKTVNFAA